MTHKAPFKAFQKIQFKAQVHFQINGSLMVKYAIMQDDKGVTTKNISTYKKDPKTVG